MPTNTSNYDFNLPLVNNATDQDLWGGYLNANWTSIDSLLFTATNWVKRIVTGTDSATIADRNKILLGNATSGAYAQTLPLAATVQDGFTIALVKIDATANAITITRSGADTIGGSFTYSLSNQNDCVVLVSDGITAWNFQGKVAAVPDASTTVKGIIEIATDVEADARVATDKALVPSNLASVFDYATSGSGYVYVGPYLVQWGNTGTYNENVSTGITFPLTFPTECYQVVGVSNTHITASSAATAITAFTAAGFTMYTGGGGGGQLRGLRWLAIGR